MMITLKRLLMMMTAAGGELEAKKSLQKRGRAPGGQESSFLIAFEDEDDEEDEEDEEFKRATKLLKEASAEVDALEKELKREMEKESTPATTETSTSSPYDFRKGCSNTYR